jgi:hypothetical protein
MPWMAVRSLDLPFSVEAGMRAAWSVIPANEGGFSVRSTYFSGILAPCWRGSWLFGCPILEVGRIHADQSGSAGRFQPLDASVIAAGLRLGVERRIIERLFFRSLVELEGVPVGAHIRDDRQQVWGTRGYSLTLGLGFAWRLW